MLFTKIYNKLSENHKRRLNNKANRSFINTRCNTNNNIIIGGSGLDKSNEIKIHCGKTYSYRFDQKQYTSVGKRIIVVDSKSDNKEFEILKDCSSKKMSEK